MHHIKEDTGISIYQNQRTTDKDEYTQNIAIF